VAHPHVVFPYNIFFPGEILPKTKITKKIKEVILEGFNSQTPKVRK
jgi:hypothetical protein